MRSLRRMTHRPKVRVCVWGVTVVVLFSALVTVGACGDSGQPAQTSSTGSYRTATVEELATALKDSAGVQLVDVREVSEWRATGVIAEAKLISLGDLKDRAADELAKDRPVYVICRSGSRSRTGAQTLVELGYREVYSVAGGITAWIEEGLPVVPYSE